MSSTNQCDYYIFRAQLRFFDFAGVFSYLMLIQILDDDLDIHFFLNQNFNCKLLSFKSLFGAP